MVGTSALVYPAADLPQLTKQSGGKVYEFNTEATPLSLLATQSFLGPCEETLPAWWAGFRQAYMTV